MALTFLNGATDFALLTFLDGAIYSSIWAVAPLLVSCLLLEGSPDDNASFAKARPTTSKQALDLLTTLFRPLTSPDAKQIEGISRVWKSIPGHLSLVLVAYMVGRSLGSFVGGTSALLRVCPQRLRTLPSNRVLSILSSILVSLLMINWGFGVSTYSGWVIVRFFTAFISGAIVRWGNRYLDNSKEIIDDSDQQLMEEGRPFISRSCDHTSPMKAMIWMDKYWLAGVASASILSGFAFYLLNFISPHRKFFTFLIISGVVVLTDRCLSMFYFRSATSKRTARSVPSAFEDVGIIQMTKMSTNTGLNYSNQTKQEHYSHTPQRKRMNSISSVESDVFFDCMDDIELGFDEAEEKKTQQSQIQSPTQNNTNQLAIYSNRRVVYPDGAPAFVPVGERQTEIPQGYKTLYKHNAASNYLQTQQWRRLNQINRIHSRPHVWYPKIKDAYPHFIHGFSKNGMPVIYESPGKMNLKELFRNGCSVDDMIFHYCYLMEYLSNLESILTELYSELSGEEWQEELGAYVHKKQQRLQSDSVAFGFVVVMDISGASPSLLSSDVMSYLSRAGEINSLHYPGSMRQAVAVQAPFWLGAAWGAIKNVMPASVTVDLLSASKTMEGGLKEYIDADQIPREYGGTSRFRLGEHPFEVGLGKLVETQPTDDFHDEEDELHDIAQGEASMTPLHSTLEEPSRYSKLLNDNMGTDNSLPKPQVIEWDDLDSDYVLMVATILFVMMHMLIGGIELVLPLLLVIPPKQGVGFETGKTAITSFATCMAILWLSKRTRVSSRITTIIEISPLSAFRIGLGSNSFFWLCAGCILSILPPNTSKLGMLCLIVDFTLIFFSSTLGIASVSYLRQLSIVSFAKGDHTLPRWCRWIQHDNITNQIVFFARVFGILCSAPVLRWYVVLPFTGTCFIVLACICGFLYVVSFALHSVTPPPPPATTRRRKKVSQFVTAMKGLGWFIKDLVLVAVGDTKFLWKEGKVNNK
eukprot:scaffold44700_cov81-Cyclotella_meneghiniana.AAC.8